MQWGEEAWTNSKFLHFLTRAAGVEYVWPRLQPFPIRREGDLQLLEATTVNWSLYGDTLSQLRKHFA